MLVPSYPDDLAAACDWVTHSMTINEYANR